MEPHCGFTYLMKKLKHIFSCFDNMRNNEEIQKHVKKRIVDIHKA